MSDTMIGYSDYAEQYFHQPSPSELFHDPRQVNMVDTTAKSSIGSSYSGGPSQSSQLNSKSSITKPIRRRSRVSKNTPVTLLNADISNFRYLVQQFTGCEKVGARKGPIDLNFSKASQLGSNPSATVMGRSSGYNKEVSQRSFVDTQLQEQEKHEGESMFHNFENISMPNDGYFLSVSSPNPKFLGLDDQFLLQDGTCLSEFIDDVNF